MIKFDSISDLHYVQELLLVTSVYVHSLLLHQ